MGKPVGRRARLILIVLGGILVLTACGGGDAEEDPTPTAEPEPTATAPIEEPSTASPPSQEATPLTASPVVTSPSASAVPAVMGSPQAEALGATVVLTDFRVNLFQTAFTVGQPYTFVVENNGGVAHSFAIESSGTENQPLENDGRRAEIVEIPAGGRATLTWTFAEPGEYQIACHRDGHYARGMVQDNIVVTE